MENKIKFSIIIPAYNAIDTISNTLDSILNQSYQNYEIIVVDDCSTDGTYDFLKQYNGITLLRTEYNLRQGGARNLGLDNCTGNYILFVDSDDLLYDSSVLEKLVICIAQNNFPDIVYMGMQIEGKRDLLLMPTIETCTKDYQLAETKWLNVLSICWKNELIQKNHIRFPEKIRYEDVYFHFLGIEKSRSFAYCDFIFYRYLNRENSTTTTYSFEQSIDTVKLIKELSSLSKIISKEHLPLLEKRIHQQATRASARLERAIKQAL